MKRALLAIVLWVPIMMMGQDDEKKFNITFNGFVKTDIFWDSRQTVDVREGHFYLYPANELLDETGEDINARSKFNFLSIQTRLRTDITGPEVLGAKPSAAIEGEFFGHGNGDINGFRLRHAYVKLNWTSTELLVGQFWHPLFITSSYPGTVNFNTGVPFLPFSRNPQIRLSQSIGGFKAYITALSQVDFRSNGPDGANVNYLRNTAMPALNLNLEYVVSKDGFKFLIGVAGGYKTLLPRMATDSNYKTDEKVGSMTGQAYIKMAVPAITIKAAGTYAQDAYDLTMIGGYAVSNITDTLKNFQEYTPVSTLAFWADIHTNGKRLQGGLFIGYTKNMGSSDIINTGTFYSRGSNIAYVYRISPRLIYNVGKFRIAPELDYTVAAYGKSIGTDGIPLNTKDIGNFRFLLGVYYFF
jgi:hypothetical protein